MRYGLWRGRLLGRGGGAVHPESVLRATTPPQFDGFEEVALPDVEEEEEPPKVPTASKNKRRKEIGVPNHDKVHWSGGLSGFHGSRLEFLPKRFSSLGGCKASGLWALRPTGRTVQRERPHFQLPLHKDLYPGFFPAQSGFSCPWGLLSTFVFT